SFHWSRNGQINCGSPSMSNAPTTSLVFAPGVNGVIADWGGDLNGCRIVSLGYGRGLGTTGGNRITNIAMVDAGVPRTAWEAGDGIIAVSAWNGFPPASGTGPSGPMLAVSPGAYISGTTGDPQSNNVAVTLASGYTIGPLASSINNNQVAVYRLPVKLAYH